MALVVVELTLRLLGIFLVSDRTEAPTGAASGKPVFTVLCIGDSWTQGAESGRFPDSAAARLNGRAGRPHFRWINVGRAGTTSF